MTLLAEQEEEVLSWAQTTHYQMTTPADSSPTIWQYAPLHKEGTLRTDLVTLTWLLVSLRDDTKNVQNILISTCSSLVLCTENDLGPT